MSHRRPSCRVAAGLLAALLTLPFLPALPAGDSAAPTPTAEASRETMALYGGPEVEGTRGLPVDYVVANADMFHGVTVGIDATIEEVCQVKGCWMTLKSDVAGAPPVRVRFRNYGFFVPRNASGHRAVLIGRVARVELPEEVARHYAEDGGASPEELAKIVGPQPAIEIVATSVAIDGPATLDAPYAPAPKAEDGEAAPASQPTSQPSAS